MHQSWILLIQCRYVEIHSPGTNRTRPASPVCGSTMPPSLTASRHNRWIVLPGHSGCDAGAGVRIATYHLSLIHISEPTRLLSISYAVFCLKKKKIDNR